MKMAQPKTRSYCFTINNWTSEDYDGVMALDSQYLVVGKETGEEGTPHLQGYVYFSTQRHFNAVKKAMPRAHISGAKGTPLQNRVYCTKGGDWVEKGEMPKQGKRSDLEVVRDLVKETGKMRDVVEVASSFQSVKMAEQWLKYHEKARDWKPEVRWYYGATGTGKTKAAREWLGEGIYTCMNDGKWFEGYDGHEAVLVDDFRKDFCKFHVLLKFLDRYEYRVETKGGSRQMRARKIAITAPYHPSVIYETREDVGQLLRRIDQVILVGNPPEDHPDFPSIE